MTNQFTDDEPKVSSFAVLAVLPRSVHSAQTICKYKKRKDIIIIIPSVLLQLNW